jgi:hypothetical protein
MLHSAVYYNVITQLEFMKEYHNLVTEDENEDLFNFFNTQNYAKVISETYVSGNYEHWSTYASNFESFNWESYSFNYQYSGSLSYSYSEISVFYKENFSADYHYVIKQSLINWEESRSWDYTFYSYYSYCEKWNSFYTNSYFSNSHEGFISDFNTYIFSSKIEVLLIRIKVLSEIEFKSENYDDFYSVDIRIQANFESFIKKYS